MRGLNFTFYLLTCNLVLGQSPLDIESANGKVKSIFQIQFHIDQQSEGIKKGDTISCSFHNYFFDKKKKVLKEEFCEIDVLFSYENKYDNEGNIVERNNFGKLNRKYEYDNMGNQVKESMFDNEGLIGYWLYRHDENGDRIERTGFMNNDFIERWIMEYDNNKRLIKEYMVSEEPNDTPTYLIKTYKYDKNGRLITFISTDPETKVNAIETFKYNIQNDIIEHHTINNFQGTERRVNYRYTYDKKRNWTQRIELDNEKPMRIVERRIEYR